MIKMQSSFSMFFFLLKFQNKTPVYVANVCKPGEILYPGDQFDDWVCDCKPGKLFYHFFKCDDRIFNQIKQIVVNSRFMCSVFTVFETLHSKQKMNRSPFIEHFHFSSNEEAKQFDNVKHTAHQTIRVTYTHTLTAVSLIHCCFLFMKIFFRLYLLPDNATMLSSLYTR